MAVRRISARSTDDRLGAADLRAVLDLVQQTSSAAHPDEFADVATRGLYRLVGCDFASFNEVNMEHGRAVLFTEPREALRPDAEEAFARNLAQHPIAVFYAANGGGPALRMSDFVTLRQFRRTALYDELFVPVDGNYVLALPLPVPPGVVVGFALVRGAPDFNDRDRAVLGALQPHLAAAYERSLLRAVLGAVDGASPTARLLVLDGGGDLLYAGDVAEAALRRAFPEPRRSGLPEGVAGWLARGCPGPFTATRGGVRLTLRPVGSRPVALLVTESSTRPSPEALRDLGLTPREAEVLTLVCGGLTNAQIAGRLVTSPRTVKKHLENVYGKLGVHSRSGAAAIALSASPSSGHMAVEEIVSSP